MYLTHTKPDVMFYVSMISRFMYCRPSHHLSVAKRKLKYICRTLDLEYIITRFKILIWLDIQTVIGLDHAMIERALVDMCLI